MLCRAFIFSVPRSFHLWLSKNKLSMNRSLVVVSLNLKHKRSIQVWNHLLNFKWQIKHLKISKYFLSLKKKLLPWCWKFTCRSNPFSVRRLDYALLITGTPVKNVHWVEPLDYYTFWFELECSSLCRGDNQWVWRPTECRKPAMFVCANGRLIR